MSYGVENMRKLHSILSMHMYEKFFNILILFLDTIIAIVI